MATLRLRRHAPGRSSRRRLGPGVAARCDCQFAAFSASGPGRPTRLKHDLSNSRARLHWQVLNLKELPLNLKAAIQRLRRIPSRRCDSQSRRCDSQTLEVAVAGPGPRDRTGVIPAGQPLASTLAGCKLAQWQQGEWGRGARSSVARNQTVVAQVQSAHARDPRWHAKHAAERFGLCSLWQWQAFLRMRLAQN